MAKSTFSVRNFEQFQHYRDRTPIWIKLYNSLLEDYEFGLLPDASKAHLVAIWLLASRFKNKIPLDGNWVAQRINATSTVDLSLLEKAGFIEFNQPCSDMLADRYQVASPEKKREQVQVIEERDMSAGADFDAFWKDYPKDKNMSKKQARVVWMRLPEEKRSAAVSAIPGFLAYCRANSWYRPVHAERFLSQERFEGYDAEPELDEATIDANKDRADKLMRRGKYADKYQ